MKNLFSFFNVLAFVLLVLSFAAITWVKRPPPAPEAPNYVLSERLPVEVPVYYLDASGQKLVSEKRKVPVVQGDKNPQGIADAALTIWSQGPAGEGLKPAVPTRLPAPRVWLRGDNYFVSLPPEYRNLGYSVSGEYLMFCSITRTLLESRGLDVTFLVGGQNVTTIGAMDLRQPLTKQDCKDL
ncbi:GerMN domain-containing protein [Deinococcus sp. Marseille-Q6407]|uniref:GerMN domain-containing protein n=1 Tax=Deinococcus sp. Marseille-Q6407 TaxID=2969223 RepID=UPI0021BE9C93|nr:GerMN domain-containing protein [Deinococcus sp. Marseille-Q6407]